MNLDDATLAKLHRDQTEAVVAWLETNRSEWDTEPGNDRESPAHSRNWLLSSLSAFKSMLARGKFKLTDPQIKWVRDVAERCNIT